MKVTREYKCDQCGEVAEWSDGWSRWGSMLTEEFGHEIVTCSESCRVEIGDHEAAFKKKYGRSTQSRYYLQG